MKELTRKDKSRTLGNKDNVERLKGCANAKEGNEQQIFLIPSQNFITNLAVS